MVDGYPAQPQVDVGLIRDVFRTIGLPYVTGVLQNRGISYVGINEPNNTIIVFTKKRLSVGERKQFTPLATRRTIANEAIRIEFVHGNIVQVQPNPPPPPTAPPYVQINDRYTCGSSIYIGSEKGAGTLGCLVRDAADVLHGLSNNHVTGGSNYAMPGLPIMAPGMADVAANGRDPETLGHHARAYPFIDGIPDIVDARENIDAAIFEIRDVDRVSSMQRNEYDTPAVSLPMAVGMTVQKVGRSTGLTNGTVIAELFDFEQVGYHIDIMRGFKSVYFRSLFVVRSATGVFSAPGDSGSLVVTADPTGNKIAVGIVVAGNDEGNTLCLSIDRILTYFGITLVAGHNI
jgi:hypothetical protein